MTLPRTIAVFTSTRADAWPLGPVLDALQASPDVELLVIATGTHLEARRGSTMGDLASYPVVVADVPIESDRPLELAGAAGRMVGAVAAVLADRKVDVLVLLGDRWELLGAATAAVILGTPIAHIHGGEVTEGAIDDRIRHAVTKLADLHFCATEEYGARIRQLGEEPWRVHVTGAPALDRLVSLEPPGLPVLEQHLGVELARPFGLVTYHPPTVDGGDVAARAQEVLAAAAARLASVVVTLPGADPGSEAVIEAVSAAAARHASLHVVPSLGVDYAAALANADVMIGNSSSGIIEAATFHLPVVNVGDRQKGRMFPANVIQAEESQASVEHAIDRALEPAFRKGLHDLVNPYGDGRAAGRIVEALVEVPMDSLRRKRFVDVGGAS